MVEEMKQPMSYALRLYHLNGMLRYKRDWGLTLYLFTCTQTSAEPEIWHKT